MNTSETIASQANAEKTTSADVNEFITSILGEERSHDDILTAINSDPIVLNTFNSFSSDDRKRIMQFLEGKRSLQILDDTFFNHVLRPDTAPERCESLISAIFGQDVSILSVLPREGLQITDIGSQVVMDIIVKISDGSIANVEMQRVGYLFPGERTSCYLADMTMRQYNLTRSKLGKSFSYRDMKPIRLIVIMDQSSAEFSAVAPEYMHTRISSYSSGAAVTDLEHVTYISLDTYRSLGQNEIKTKLDAWLTFFSYEDPEHVISLVNKYPEFLPLYRNIAEFRHKPEEVIGMFSEALKIMDRNTTKYMIDELKQTITDQNQTITDQNQTIADQNQTITDQNQTIADYSNKITTLEAENKALKAQLAAK